LLSKCYFLIPAPLEKLLQITLVRDVDGKTFWDALSDAISPRIAKPTTADETALSTFRSVFQDRPLKKGTFIFLTWLNPSKLLVSFSFPTTCRICHLRFFFFQTIEIINLSFLPSSPTLSCKKWFQLFCL